jgi:hypothetical protein
MDDKDKKEGIITTAQDTLVDTAKAGWEGAQELAGTATSIVTDAVSGLTHKRPRKTRRKAKTASARTTGARRRMTTASSRRASTKTTKKKSARKAGGAAARRTALKSRRRSTARSR